jgi:molecular chaperone GrpE
MFKKIKTIFQANSNINNDINKKTTKRNEMSNDTTNEFVDNQDELSAEEQEALENVVAEASAESTTTTANPTDALQNQVAELKDKYIRLLAEFDNFKKRNVKERLDLMRTASQDTLTSLLPILDDFDRAQKSGELSEGTTMIYNKLFSTLSQKGLQAMESTGLPFDPELHEAITEFPAPSEDMKGKVFDTVEKGYTLNEKIIRHAKVVVGV